MADTSAGSAYLSKPDEGPGPGVLLLHSWWGLTSGVKERADALAEQGFTVLVPALLEGPDPRDVEGAVQRLAAADVDATAALILSSIVALRANSRDPEAPVGMVGQSMGASWAMWAATRQPDSVAAVVAHYGTQSIDFDELRAPVMVHLADLDPLVSQDAVAEMVAHLRLAEKSVETHLHDGVRHFFAEEGVPVLGPDGIPGERNGRETAAADQVWASSKEFLARHLGAAS